MNRRRVRECRETDGRELFRPSICHDVVRAINPPVTRLSLLFSSHPPSLRRFPFHRLLTQPEFPPSFTCALLRAPSSSLIRCGFFVVALFRPFLAGFSTKTDEKKTKIKHAVSIRKPVPTHSVSSLNALRRDTLPGQPHHFIHTMFVGLATGG